jgi:regulator of sirC expression with transglutaminase-like and TPR domain
MRHDLVDALTTASNAPGPSLAPAALVIARLEYPRLDAERYLRRLDVMGDAARRRIERHVAESGDATTLSRVRGLNSYLFDEEGFVGNRDKYEDPRNSCLNEVLERRTGIPITLSLLYIEVAQRALPGSLP